MGKPTMRNQHIDLLKGVACICVVLIHCQFPGRFGAYIGGLLKFAVPVFFMISGYYAVNNSGEYKLKKKLYHILNLAILAELLYSVFELIKIVLKGENVASYIIDTINPSSIFGFIVFNDPFTSSHLWFLWALIYCYITLWLMRKLNVNEVVLVVLAIVGLLCFFVSGELLVILGLPYKFMINFGNIQYGYAVFNLYLCRALPFFIVGYVIRNIHPRIVLSKTYLIMFLGFNVLAVIERLNFGWLQYYVGSFGVSIMVFLCAIEKSDIPIKNQMLLILAKIGEKYSDFVYIIHLLVQSVILILFKTIHVNAESLLYFLYPIVAVFASLGMAYIRQEFIERIKQWKRIV